MSLPTTHVFRQATEDVDPTVEESQQEARNRQFAEVLFYRCKRMATPYDTFQVFNMLTLEDLHTFLFE
jgi:hypothetical protein